MAKRNEIVKMSGKCAFGATIANGNSSVEAYLTPAIAKRGAKAALTFEFYRFTHLRCVLPPQVRFETTWPNNIGASTYAFGYLPEVTNAVTTTLTATDVAELECSFIDSMTVVNANTIGSTVNSVLLIPGSTQRRSVNVPRRVLCRNPTNWYRTSATTSDDIATIQGTLMFAVTDTAGANTVVFSGDLYYELEFKGQSYMSDFTLSVPEAVEEAKSDEPIVIFAKGGGSTKPLKK